MKILHVGLMVGNEPYDKGLDKELKAQSTEYRALQLKGDDLNQRILMTAHEFMPDIIFMQIQREGIVTVDTVKTLHEKGFFVINWTGDVRSPIPQWYFDLAPYCVTSFSNMNDVLEMREFGLKSEFLQIGYDPQVFYKKEGVYKDLDIVFMGNNYRGMFPLSDFRVEMVTRMKKEFGERFRVYGNGWECSSGDLNGNQDAENDIYNRAKIGINLSHFNYSHYSSDRMYRLMGSGCLCLSHFYPNITEDFDITTIGLWEGIDDLIKACKMYLSAHDEMLEIMGVEGMKYVQNFYSYKQMAENIIKMKQL